MIWKTVKLSDVCDLQNGFAFKSSLFREEGLPILRISNIQNEEVSLEKLVYFVEKDYDISFERYKVLPNDLLIAMSGATTGKLGFNQSGQTLYLNQRVGKFEPKSGLAKKYLYYVLSTKVEENLSISKGAAQPNLSTQQIKDIEFPLPPLAEQKRIVAKLDAAFAEIDRAIEFDGEKLLEAENLGAAYLDKRLKTLLHDKPSVCLSDVCERVSVGHVGTTSKYYCDKGIPFIRTQNVSETGFDDTELKYITPEFHETLKKSQVKAGDVLLSRVVIDEMRAAIVPKNYGDANCANVILIRPQEKLLPQYLSLLIKSRESQKYFMGVKKGAAQQVVNTGILKKWNIPLPSIDEQAKFVEEITNSFELVKSLLTSVTNKKHELTNLKSAILTQELQAPQSEAA